MTIHTIDYIDSDYEKRRQLFIIIYVLGNIIYFDKNRGLGRYKHIINRNEIDWRLSCFNRLRVCLKAR